MSETLNANVAPPTGGNPVADEGAAGATTAVASDNPSAGGNHPAEPASGTRNAAEFSGTAAERGSEAGSGYVAPRPRADARRNDYASSWELGHDRNDQAGLSNRPPLRRERTYRYSFPFEMSYERGRKAFDFSTDGSVRLHLLPMEDHPHSRSHSRRRRSRRSPDPGIGCELPPRTVRLVLLESKAALEDAYLAPSRDSDAVSVDWYDVCECCYDRSLRPLRVAIKVAAKAQISLPVSLATALEVKVTIPQAAVTVSHLQVTPIRVELAPVAFSQITATQVAIPAKRSFDRSPERDNKLGHQARSESRSTYATSSDFASTSSDEDSVESEASSVYHDSWKLYRGASGIDVGDLLSLWDRSSRQPTLKFGTNSIFVASASHTRNVAAMMHKTSRESHAFMLHGRLIRFYTLPNILRANWNAQEALEMELVIFKHRDFNQLGAALKRQLQSQDSAMRLFTGSLDVGARLLVLDILTAVMQCWHVFLGRIRRRGIWKPRTVGGLEDIEDKIPLLGDSEYLRDFAKATRDLIRASEITIETIELTSDADNSWDRKFKYLAFRVRIIQEQLDADITGIESDASDVIANVERLANEKQAASLRRLTLVASIFLPLTTACSLLSMTTRVRDLGPLWWDWLGIVIIVAFIVVIGYQSTAGWQELTRNVRIRWIFRLVRDVYRNAKVKVFKRANKQGFSIFRTWKSVYNGLRGGITMGIAMAGTAPIVHRARIKNKIESSNKKRNTQRDRQRSLVPILPKALFRTIPYLLWLGFVASFLVGMFLEIDFGAKLLGYCAAGTVGFSVVVILLWRLLQTLLWGLIRLRKIRKAMRERQEKAEREKEEAKREQDGRLDIEAGRAETSEDGSRSRPPPGMEADGNFTKTTRWIIRGLRVLFTVILVSFLCLGSIVYAVVGFFIGTTLFDVIIETVTHWFVIFIVIASERERGIRKKSHPATPRRKRSPRRSPRSRSSSSHRVSIRTRRSRTITEPDGIAVDTTVVANPSPEKKTEAAEESSRKCNEALTKVEGKTEHKTEDVGKEGETRESKEARTSSQPTK